MKYAVALLLLLGSISLFAQYPDGGRRSRLGYATTGDGLIVQGDGAPNYTPTSLKNAYAYMDTTNNRVFYFANGAWRKLSEAKYMNLQADFLAGAVVDSLLEYEAMYLAFDLLSGATANIGVQLPVTGLDSTYAGRIVRVAARDSSGSYYIQAASSSPNGIAIGDSLATAYILTNYEVAEFQLYQYADTIWQWRLVNSSIGGGGAGGDGNGLISALPLTTVVINADDNSLTIDSLNVLLLQTGNLSSTARSRLFSSSSSALPSVFQYSSSGDTARVKLSRNASANSQIALDAQDILHEQFDASKAMTSDFRGLLGVDSSGLQKLVHPDSIPKILALIDTTEQHRIEIDALTDSISVLRDSISDLRTAITALQSATSAPLQYYEFDIGNATGWLIATDTAGLNFTLSSGTATFTIPSGVASYNLSFNGQDSDLPGNDLTVVINQTSSVINQGGTTTVPRHFEVVSRPDASSSPSSGAPFVYGSPTSPQRRIEGQSSGNVTLKAVNIKNAYDFWTVSLIK